MRKQFSHALIIILILICPLSFTTEKVPDFKPECNISVTALEPRAAMAARRLCAPVRPAAYPESPVTEFYPFLSQLPIERFTTPPRGRSP